MRRARAIPRRRAGHSLNKDDKLKMAAASEEATRMRLEELRREKLRAELSELEASSSWRNVWNYSRRKQIKGLLAES